MKETAGKTFRNLFETGIRKYWVDEFYELATSTKMRDRIRHEKRIVRQEEMKVTRPLSLEDKATNIFVGLLNLQAMGVVILLWERQSCMKTSVLEHVCFAVWMFLTYLRSLITGRLRQLFS